MKRCSFYCLEIDQGVGEFISQGIVNSKFIGQILNSRQYT